jgi:hypothetical protein
MGKYGPNYEKVFAIDQKAAATEGKKEQSNGHGIDREISEPATNERKQLQ